MRSFCLSTGSSGNSFYVEGRDGTGVLVETGLSYNRTVELLEEKNIDINSLKGIFITHEHTDHIGGLSTFIGKIKCPIYISRGTLKKIDEKYDNFQLIKNHDSLELFGLKVLIIDRPHDCEEPVSFIFDDGEKKLGIFTDMGHVTDEIKHTLKNLDHIYFEANYCSDHIKENGTKLNANYLNRLMSNVGHLGLHQTSEALCVTSNSSQKIVLSHVSENTNTYENTYRRIKSALEEAGKFPELIVGFQGEPTEWLE